jgi:DNA (cytosine-5)-methyltransferase 1
MPIPIIDLFAGPGGLGEGFASLTTKTGEHAFQLAISIEKEASAYRTLLLRAVQRRLVGSTKYQHYVDYVTGRIPTEQFCSIPSVMEAFEEACCEAKQYELGNTPEAKIDSEIAAALGGASEWVLIGGPPCQAYSLAGRSRRANDKSFSKDVKHFLYREYLRIIHKFKPAVFVMENVKGLLSSTHSGASMFNRIVDDLGAPFDGVEYEIVSLVQRDHGLGLSPEDYLIQAERYGTPQTRHRVILLGIRKGFGADVQLLETVEQVTVADAIHDLPPIRSRISREADSPAEWHRILATAAAAVKGHVTADVLRNMKDAARAAKDHVSVGSHFISHHSARGNPFGARYISSPPTRRRLAFREWVARPEIGGFLQHESRSHMASDLGRYLYAACYAQQRTETPRLRMFPEMLLPAHRNAQESDGVRAPFQDRFRVQLMGAPSTTIVSHIAKDGHYYIHYDPSQCRSLTVREAARLQTFPDDYYFEGNRTEQYTQVGNAVPPLLAHNIAGVVWRLMTQATVAVERERAAA